MDCIFCKIINGEIPGKFIYKDDKIAAFYDISPKAPIHALVIPVKHIASLADINEDDKDLMGELLLSIQKVAQKLGLEKSGFKLISNNGKGAGQIVFHLHFHILGGWSKSPKWQV